MTDPIFMSAEHVAVMNQRLDASAEVKQAAAELPRTVRIAYRLRDDRADRTVHWVMQLGPEGVRFSLSPTDRADLTFVGDYWGMIAASRTPGGGDEAALETLGDPAALESVAEVFALAQRFGAVPVSWPEPPVRFMSPEHVEAMNAVLAGSDEVRAACAVLDAPRLVSYRLSDGPDGEVVHWAVGFADTVTFSLGEAAASDVVLSGDWGRMVRSAAAARRGEQVDPGVSVSGDAGVVAQVAPVLALAGTVATLPVEFPGTSG